MPNLLSTPITTAVSSTTTPVSICMWGPPNRVTFQANFVYGSGGTNATAYVQTSLDSGTTWIDIVCFQFTTSTARKIVNLSSATAITTLATPTDGSMTANTSLDGVLGDQFRIKWVTTGTYGGTTTLSIDCSWSFVTPH